MIFKDGMVVIAECLNAREFSVEIIAHEIRRKVDVAENGEEFSGFKLMKFADGKLFMHDQIK